MCASTTARTRSSRRLSRNSTSNKGGEHDNKQISFDSWRNKETEKFILTNLEDAKYFAHEFLDGYFRPMSRAAAPLRRGASST